MNPESNLNMKNINNLENPQYLNKFEASTNYK